MTKKHLPRCSVCGTIGHVSGKHCPVNDLNKLQEDNAKLGLTPSLEAEIQRIRSKWREEHTTQPVIELSQMQPSQVQTSPGFAFSAVRQLQSHWKKTAFVFLLCLLCIVQRASAGNITGQFQTATGGVIGNGTLTFHLSQPIVIAGSGQVITQDSNCYTSTAGNIVGLPDPLVLPVTSANLVSGTLPAGTYYVVLTYLGASGETLASSETTQILSAQGTLNVNAPALQPASATGYNVYIGTSSGTEKLQGAITGWGQFQQTSALVGSTALPGTNSTVCSIHFSDEGIPTGTYYNVNLVNKNGSKISGFPQTWCTYGGTNGVINVSNGAPVGSCGFNGVFYPTPIFTVPANNSPQSISGPLSLTGTLNSSALINGLCSLNGVAYVGAGVPFTTCWGSSDVAAQITAAIASLPSTGGTVDARGITSTQTFSTTLTIAKNGVRLLLPETGRITCTSLPCISVSSGVTGVEIIGRGNDSNQATDFTYAGTTAGDFIAFVGSNYGLRVVGIYCESTAALAGQTACVHATDTYIGEIGYVFASDQLTSNHAGELVSVINDVSTTGLVPPRGQITIHDIFRSNANDASVTSVPSSAGIIIKGAAGANGQIQAVHVQGSCNLENVGTAIALQDAIYNTIDCADWSQANARDLTLVRSTNNIIRGMHGRCNGAARCIEHANIDASSTNNVFQVDFADSGFGTNSSASNYIHNFAFASPTITPGLTQFVAPFRIADDNTGLGLRIIAGAGFGGIGFRDNSDSTTKSQIYWASSDNSFHIFHNGSDRLIFNSSGVGAFQSGMSATNATLTTPTIGGGSTINKVLQGSGTLTYTAISAQTCQEQTFTVSGASSGDPVFASPATGLGNTNLSWSVYVSAGNTVDVRVCNPSSGSVTPTAVVWKATVFE